MIFRNKTSSLELEIVRYEFPADEGEPGSDDRNWLVLRGTYTTEDGTIIKDSNSCLLTYELRELTAGLKVLNAGIREEFGTDFTEPFFELFARSAGAERFLVDVAFTMPNTMEDIDTAEVECTLTKAQMTALIGELDTLCAKFPDRK